MHDISSAQDDLLRRQRHLTALYSDHHTWLHHWLRKKLGCSHRAADLAHDAFIRILSLAEPQRIEEPRAFLATTANRLMIDSARRRRLEEAYLDALAIRAAGAGMPDPEAIHTALQALDRIADMLGGLPANVREAFLLSRLDGLTYHEIATHLKVSAACVKNYIARALVHCYTAVHGQAARS